MVPTFAAADADAAVAQASGLFAQGATVVLKIMSRDIVHKSDVGGVVLNLTTADAVRSAAADIIARAKALRPEARISGVVVQAMVLRQKARELILGLADDPTFGTVVVFGRGGTAVEIINDKALALPPLDLPSGPRPDRAHPRLPAAARLPRRAGGEAGRRRDGAGQAGADGRGHSGDPRTRHQSAAGGRSGRAGRRRARRGRAGGAKIRRNRPRQFRGAALSVAMAAASRGQGWLAGLCASDPARGRAADPRIPASRHASRICGCASSRR